MEAFSEAADLMEELMELRKQYVEFKTTMPAHPRMEDLFTVMCYLCRIDDIEKRMNQLIVS